MPITRETISQTLATPYGEAAYHVVAALQDAGFDSWWVGGAVRDLLQGKTPTDIDIATAAAPAQVRLAFPRKAGKEESFGSVRVTKDRFVFEVTTFREDDEASDGRHPESVVFGTREQDAKRRDFTVNAIYWHPISQALYDPFAGEADLQERLIRFIGDPAVRIKHDALRMLRAVRFRSLLDGQYHPETYRALQELPEMIDVLSGERLLREFEKMLLGPHPDRALEDLWELRLLERFLPELSRCKGVPQPADYHHEGDVWDHTLQLTRAFKEEDGIDVRIAAVFHDCGKSETFSLKERIRFDQHATVSGELAAKALARLQMPGKRIEKIVWVIRHHMMMGAFFDMTDERKAAWYFHPWFPDLLRVFELDIAGTMPSDYSLYERIMRDYHAFLDAHPRPATPLLTGEDVMEIMGIAPGEQVGAVLQQLHAAQTRGEITTKKEAHAFVRRLVA